MKITINRRQWNSMSKSSQNIPLIKKKILKYYNENVSQDPQINRNLLNAAAQFKDIDLIISVLYEDLYAKIMQYNKQLEKILQKIKLEQNKSTKIEDLLNFYSMAYSNVDKEELSNIRFDIKKLSIEEINKYIDKYVSSWRKI
jgi:DNA mismatch repair ATPase MutS